MAEESDMEHTEQVTPQRIQQVYEEVQAARSQKLTTFTLLPAAVVGLIFMDSNLIEELLSIMNEGIRIERELAFQSDLLLNHFYLLAGHVLYSTCIEGFDGEVDDFMQRLIHTNHLSMAHITV